MKGPVRLQLKKQIETADQVDALRSLRDQVNEQMKALLPTHPVEPYYEQLNEAHDLLIRRAVRFAEEQMARMGRGSPPVPYAYLLFGSGGREEQTLSSDQDSGIVYKDPVSDHEAVKAYFGELSGIIVNNLQKAGYPPCEGSVISSHSDWRLSQTGWHEKLDGWFKEPSWEAVRYLLIIADARCVYGDEQLLSGLKDYFFADIWAHPNMVRRMLENTMRHKMLLGIFGHLLKEQYGMDAGSLDIKYGAYIPMVNAIRLLSIQSGIRETSTLNRIDRLVKKGDMSEMDGAAYKQAFKLVLRMRLMATEETKDGLYANNGKLSRRMLTKELTDELKTSLKLGKKLQRTVYKQTMGRLM